MDVIIINKALTLTLSFDDTAGREFVSGIEACINTPHKHPFIRYRDKNDMYILTSEFLKNSLIQVPKPTGN